MKRISTYINEKLHINNTTKIEYMYHPKDKDELIKCIKKKIKKEGLGNESNPLDLNDIDTSKIKDMALLFDADDGSLEDLSKTGYFDISNWDVSNVTNMEYMFFNSAFNGDISKWDVSSVINMHSMFNRSKFNKDIGKWDVSNVINMAYMFGVSEFNGNISEWDVSNVKDMHFMFIRSKFTGENGDISEWKVSNVINMYGMFSMCPLEKNPPKWYDE